VFLQSLATSFNPEGHYQAKVVKNIKGRQWVLIFKEISFLKTFVMTHRQYKISITLLEII
jgi:hypothetical protein